MNYGKYLVVLVAAFVLMIPAFSTPDDGHSMVGQDNQQRTYDNQNSMMGAMVNIHWHQVHDGKWRHKDSVSNRLQSDRKR